MGPTRADTILLWKSLLKSCAYECVVVVGMVIVWVLGRNYGLRHANELGYVAHLTPLWRLIFWVVAFVVIHVGVWRAMNAMQLKGEDTTKGQREHDGN